VDSQDVIINNKIKSFYKRRKGSRLGELYTFEFLDEDVRVEVLRGGREYQGSSALYLSYEEFNKFVDVGRKRQDGWDLLLSGDTDQVTFTDDAVGWEYKDGGFYVKERVGGGNLGAIEYDGIEVDKGSVYIVTTYWGDTESDVKRNGDGEVRDNIKLVKIEKNELMIYRKDIKKLVEVEELKTIIENKMKRDSLTILEYKMKGISHYFNLKREDVTKAVDEELKRAISEGTSVDWGSVK